MRNRIYIPFQKSVTIGGPSIFMSNLKIYLDKIGYNYSKRLENIAGIFFPISYDIETIKMIKKCGGKVIQRLDGIYYPSQHGNSYLLQNKDIEKIYKEYSDIIIFQSQYSRKQCFSMMGEIPENKYKIIHNGVLKNIFYPNKRYQKNSKIRFVTTGSFRKKVMIEPIVKALDSLKCKYNFEYLPIGPIVNKNIVKYYDRDYINHIVGCSSKKVSKLLRTADIFIHSQLNDNCPNAVIEAISTGLPIVGFDSGAMSELCWFNKDLLVYVSNEIFHRYEELKSEKMSEKIELCINNYNHYKQIALKNADLYSIEDCGKKYIEVFEKTLRDVKIKKGFILKQKKNKIVNNIIYRAKRLIINKLILKLISNELFKEIIFYQLEKRILKMKADEALKYLFDIDNRLYIMEGKASVRYGHGIHTKHKHIKYHQFFIENIHENSNILDIGCGNGLLDFEIVGNIKNVKIVGIDIDSYNIKYAKQNYDHKNIKYINGDALRYLPDDKYNIIILSNILEHIENRVEFLKKIRQKYNPEKILIRVPSFDRDWRVPLKKELGIDYRLDNTHYIEYIHDEFILEIKKAKLDIASEKHNWGEIWSVIKPA